MKGSITGIISFHSTAVDPDKKIPQRWTQHGYDFLGSMRSNPLVASSTHGEANRQCWTWLSPTGTRHRLDYMITRLTDADHGKVKVDYNMPVGSSRFRDHRPLFARICTRVVSVLSWKQIIHQFKCVKIQHVFQLEFSTGLQSIFREFSTQCSAISAEIDSWHVTQKGC